VHSATGTRGPAWPRWRRCSTCTRYPRTWAARWSTWTRPANSRLAKRVPLPTRPGDVAHDDDEYICNGGAALFLFFAPLCGWHHVTIMARRMCVDVLLDG